MPKHVNAPTYSLQGYNLEREQHNSNTASWISTLLCTSIFACSDGHSRSVIEHCLGLSLTDYIQLTKHSFHLELLYI
ncbi:hypothetical protein AQUCO_00201126v1 [Aquilegia coerulea]|uniref:Uncharacterized protein n=1 Tax=Aquilegia coerulea TaxID=218851 RepID=A0A2G5F6L3_AQUCA|nr:hypothetical protein AQUCO_00201126v1 [Aquilegia coerulea]